MPTFPQMPSSMPATVPPRVAATMHTAMYAAFVRAGFRRWSTYRQATFAGLFTNCVFGFLKCYLYLAALGAQDSTGGYGAAQLVTVVWLGQGLINVVSLWGWSELAERIRTGDVATDLLRPVNPLWSFMAADLGRAGYAATIRLMIPLAVGAVFFPMYIPMRPTTYPLLVISVVLAVLVCFAGRYLMNLSAFWLLDIRGVQAVWMTLSTVLGGLMVPIAFYPTWAQAVIWATPFPAMFQAPLDIAVERGPVSSQLVLIGVQLVWVVGLLALCSLVQRRAVLKLVVQGG